MNINDVKPCITLKFIENAWNSFLNSMKNKHQNHDYNMKLVTALNTYNMNSVTTVSIPTHIKYLHQSSKVKQHYLHTHEFSTYLILMQCQHLTCSSHNPIMMISPTSTTQQTLPRPTKANVN